MARVAHTPWHEVVKLRDDLRTGELSLAIFAADLYDPQSNENERWFRNGLQVTSQSSRHSSPATYL